MHLSNLSHWVCLLSGLLLIATALASHAQRHAAGLAQGEPAAPESGRARRIILIAVGLVAVAYGALRLFA